MFTRRLLVTTKHCKWSKRQQKNGSVFASTSAANSASITANPKSKCETDFILRRGDVHIPDIPIPEAVWVDMDKWADKPALVCVETGRQYKYSEVRKRSINLAKCLRARLKIEPQQAVAILLPNVPEFPIALLGIIEAGLVATTVNPNYKAEEISTQLIDSDAQAIITLVDYYPTAVLALKLAKKNLPILTIKHLPQDSTPSGAVDFNEFCERETSFDGLRPGKPDDIVIMPYSSGTTGLPKGVELTHSNIVANMYQCTDLSKVIRPTTNEIQDVVPAVLPMFHIYGMTLCGFKTLQQGCKIITVPKFTPDIYRNMLTDHKPQHLFVVPPIVIYLAAHESITKNHLDSVITIMSGAAPLGASDVERLFNKTGKEIIVTQGYGMTETSPAICTTPPDIWKKCLGSIGVVVPNTDIKIVPVDDPNGNPLGPNEQGELFVRGPQVMPRYHNNPKATEEVFVDGWLRTGDMAYYDKNKILWITDRLKELIKVKGFQVAPAELEAIVRDHPAVADAAVIGVPHPIHGEVPKAFVVAKTNKTIDPEDIENFVKDKVAKYKRLEGGVTVIEAIPKNASGKILRRTLKTDYADK